ncbi:MAG: hypothetical protein HYT80_09255 [Euryarchaeota archaeon]|nr:hypothetical protein [Euryarchaeota archaeon]
MNITLVITGLATCGSLLVAGVDWQWGQDDGCGEQGNGVAVDVGIGQPTANGHAGPSQQSGQPAASACGDDSEDDP